MNKITAIVVFVDDINKLFEYVPEYDNLRPVPNLSLTVQKRFCGSKMTDNARSYIRYLKNKNYTDMYGFTDF